MSGVVSGDPSAMLGYASAGVEQTERWTPAVERLRSALDALTAAMAEVPERFRLVPAVDLAEVFEDLVAEQEHEDNFVREVAEGLLRANGFEHVLTGDLPTGGEVPWPDDVLTADESSGVFASVGSASLSQQMYDTGQDDAAELLALLEEAGIVEAAWGEHLTIEDPRWDQILALLETAGSHMDDPYYATAFYDTLGVEGTLALAGALDDIAVQDTAYGGAVDHSALADPLIAGFAQYTNTMDPADWDQLVHIEADENWRQERMPLAVLFSGPGELYQPELLAQAAESVIMTRINSGQAKADLPEALVMRSLAESPDAAWYFVVDDPDAEEITSGALWLLTNPLGFGTGDYYTEAGGTEPDYLDGLTAAWMGTDSHQLIAELHELWATTAWLEGHGLPVELRDELGDPTGIGARDRLSLTAGLTPILGDLLAGYELIIGIDPFTGEEVDRWWAAAGVGLALLSIALPFSAAGVVRHMRTLNKLDSFVPPPVPPSIATGGVFRGATTPVSPYDIVRVYPNPNPGIFDSYVLVLEDGTKYLFKPRHYAAASNPENEVAAYQMDQMLGFDLVPETQPFRADHPLPVDGGNLLEQDGSIQRMADGATGPDDFFDMDVPQHMAHFDFEPEEWERLAVLDYIIGNGDRKSDNLLIGLDGRPVAIDHGTAFPEHGYTPTRVDYLFADQPLSNDLILDLNRLDVDEVERMLLNAGLSSEAAGGAVQRLEEIRDLGRIPSGPDPEPGPGDFLGIGG